MNLSSYSYLKWVAWRVLWNSACPSFHPSFHPFTFYLGSFMAFYLKFWHGARKHMNLCMTEPGFSKKDLPQKFGKRTKNVPNTDFVFNLLKNVVINFYWIYSVKKIYLLCSCTNPGKILFQIYGPKYSQPIRLQDF